METTKPVPQRILGVAPIRPLGGGTYHVLLNKKCPRLMERVSENMIHILLMGL